MQEVGKLVLLSITAVIVYMILAKREKDKNGVPAKPVDPAKPTEVMHNEDAVDDDEDNAIEAYSGLPAMENNVL